MTKISSLYSNILKRVDREIDEERLPVIVCHICTTLLVLLASVVLFWTPRGSMHFESWSFLLYGCIFALLLYFMMGVLMYKVALLAGITASVLGFVLFAKYVGIIYYLIPCAVLGYIIFYTNPMLLRVLALGTPLGCFFGYMFYNGNFMTKSTYPVYALLISMVELFFLMLLSKRKLRLKDQEDLSLELINEWPKNRKYANIYTWTYDISMDLFDLKDEFPAQFSFSQKFKQVSLATILEYVPPSQHTLFKQALLSGQIPEPPHVSFEFEMISDGMSVWLELSGCAEKNGMGTWQFSGVLVDITSKKHLEKRLVESYLDMENILNYSPSGILITSNSKIQYVNAQFLKMVNMDRATLISTDTPFQLLPNESMQYLDFVKENVGEAESHEFKLIRADNTSLEVLLMHKVIKYKGEDANLVVISDYTSRSKYLAVLKEQEAAAKVNEAYATSQKKLIEEILSSLPLMLSIYDQEGELYLNNKFMTEKFGWEARDLQDLECLNKTVNDPVNYGLLHKSLQPENTGWIPYKMLDKSGREFLTEWTCIKTENNYLIRLGIDISEKTKIKADYESAIEQLQLLNQKFIAREERLASNQEQLKAANIKLYEQNKILEESENKFKLLSEASYEAVFMLDEGVIFDHNQSACKLLGYDSSDLRKLHISDLVVPSQRASILEILNDNSSVENFDITFVKNTGRLFYGELQSKPFMYKGKSVLVFTVRDITYRKRIEMEAKNNEVNIRNLIDNINIGVYLKMSTGETFSNHTLAKMLGVSPIGGAFDFIGYVESKHIDEVRTAMDAVVKSENGIWTKDIMMVNMQDGETSEVNITMVNTTYKLKAALLISVIDINKRKKAERELQVSYAYQNALLNSGDISYWAADRNFKLLFANQYHEVITKKYFNTHIAIGQDVRTEFKKIVDEKDMEKDFQAVLNGENITRVVKTQNDQGQSLWLEFNLSPINIAGEITGVLVRTKDVTGNFNQMERIRQSEERLREAQLLAKVGNWEENEDKSDVYWSAGMYKIFNLKSGFEPHSDSLKGLLGHDNQERFASHYEEAKTSMQQVEREYKIKYNGDDRWLHVLIVKSSGKANKIKGTVLDITDSKIAENKIRDNETLLNTIIDNLPVIFHMFDAQGLSLRINDELRKFFLLSENASPVGQYNVTKDVKLFGKEHIMQVKQVFEGEKITLKNIEVDLSRVAGRRGMEYATGVKYLDSMFTPIFNHDGSLRAVIYLGIDTTDVVLKSKELEKGHQEILEATKMVSEYKLIALRSAMNPHFLFNVLNSIQYFISKNDKGQALMHLSMFSKLVRKILESSMSTKISINEEVTMLKYYIDLENLRFDQRFEVIYDIDDSLLDDDVMIPSLIIQPYVENSILHGLLNKKDGVGRLDVSIKDMDDYVLCIIQDNGIGREAAKKFRDMDHKSLGTKVTEERLKIINKFDDISLKVVDLYDKLGKPTGTRTELKIKIN